MVDAEQAYADNVGSVRRLALQFGIREQEVEDVVQEVFVAVLKPRGDEQKNMFEQHDPRRAKLKTQLGSYAKLAMRSHRERQTKRLWREIPVPDEEAAFQVIPDKEQALRDQTEVVMETTIEYDECVIKIEKALSVAKIRGSRDLRKLFRIIVDRIDAGEYLDRREIAKELGVCDTTLHSMWKDLRKMFLEMEWDKDVSA